MTVEIDNTQVLTGDAAVAEGYSWTPRREPSEKYLTRVGEAADLFGAALAGSKRKMLDLQEALTTSDFPILLGSVFDRELLTRYEDVQPVWTQFCSRSTVRDFKPKKLVDLIGGRGILDPVAQGDEYPARSKSEKEHELSVAKRGGRFQITWEDKINDDLDALRTLPDDLAQGAADTEDFLATQLLAKSGGVNTGFFKSANGNAPGTLALTADNLDQVLTDISQRKDSEGRPIVNKGQVLVVPPGLANQARRILNATELRFTDGAKTTITSNYMAGSVRLVVNPWLPVINTTSGSRAWYILPEPNSNRKALILGFLRGHEAPDLRVKADAGNRAGGGPVAPEDGGFDDDTIQYRVRHVLGGAVLEPIATYASVAPAT